MTILTATMIQEISVGNLRRGGGIVSRGESSRAVHVIISF